MKIRHLAFSLVIGFYVALWALSFPKGLQSQPLITDPPGVSGLSALTGLAKGNGAGVFTPAVAGTDYHPPATTQYVLDGTLTPVIPVGGAEIRCMMGSTAGASTPGITAARAVNAPITGTPVHGQKFTVWIYDDGVAARDVTFNAVFTPVGVAMAGNIVASNGTINKAVVVTGSYNLPAGKWQVTGISYE